MQVRQSVVLSVNENGKRRVRDQLVSAPAEDKLPKADKAPSKSRAFNTAIVVRAKEEIDDVIISSRRCESTSSDRRASQKHSRKHVTRPYWNSY